MIELYERIAGCFDGKNIGGTLGMPYEGSVIRPNIKFYSPLPRHPAANDDLDLQLVWLRALENYRTELDHNHLAKSFLECVDCHWDEYGVALRNLCDGIPPVASGTHNNFFTCGLGAAIRSEIWAAVFAGNPAAAAQYAMLDSTLDHASEGVYAEVFNAALESSILGGSSLEQAMQLAKTFLPEDSRLKQLYDQLDILWQQSGDFEVLYNFIINNYHSYNFTDAVMNGGFVYSALTAGGGDFEKSVLLAVNCAQDADCNAATTGAVIGALIGRKQIPQRWKEVLDNKIVVGDYIKCDRLPETVDELTSRIIALHNDIANSSSIARLEGCCRLPDCTAIDEKRKFQVNGMACSAPDMCLKLPDLPQLAGENLHIKTTLTLPDGAENCNLLVASRGVFTVKLDGKLAAVKGDQSLPLPAPHRVQGGRVIPLSSMHNARKFELEIFIYPTYPLPDVYINVFDWNNRHIKTRYNI